MKKWISLLMAVMMAAFCVAGLAACSKDEEDSGTEVMGEVQAAQSQSAEEPAAPGVTDAAFLTGLKKGDDYPEGKRITAVMVNNLAKARAYPVRGLSDAQVLVEIEANAKITRFMALYDDYEKIPKVGQIRSAREQFFQLILPYQAFFVHDGPAEWTEPVNIMMENYDYGNLDLNPNVVNMWKEPAPGASVEYTEFSDGGAITDAVNNGMDPSHPYNSPMFNFTPYNEEPYMPTGGTTDKLAINHTPGYTTDFEYDAGSKEYKMSMFSTATGTVDPTIDANNNKQLAFTNVVALYATFGMYPDTGAEALPKINFGGGPGYIFTNGGYEFVIWEKGSPDAPIHIYRNDEAGTEVQLNPGKTYLAIVNDQNFEDFHYSVVEGTVGENFEGEGVVNEGEVDID